MFDQEKTDIAPLSDAEIRVAKACKRLLCRFRWKVNIENRGDLAGYHFGIIAQQLSDAFKDEGLDADQYGMFIKHPGGNDAEQYGIRYTELLAFILAAV